MAGSAGAGVGMAGMPGGQTSGGQAVGGKATCGGAGSTSGGAPGGSAGTSGGVGGSGTAGSPSADVPFDPTLLAKCKTEPDEEHPGQQQIACRLDAPNGNYDVSVDLGSDTLAGSSRLSIETRHYYGVEKATTASEHQLFNLTANVRAEQHDGGQSAPADILDLVVRGTAPQLRGLGFRPAPQSITIFVAGDSTVCDWVGSNTSALNADETGWAQALAQYFNPGVAIANFADSGETATGFYGKFFGPARTALKTGDYVFIQFGHNDQKNQSSIDSYKTSLMKYVTDARTKGATPVLFTPVSRSGASEQEPGFAGLDQQVRELAADEQVAIIDLTLLSRAYYKTVPEKKLLFADGGTHLSDKGADAVAKLVSDAIKSGALPLKSFVK